MVSIITITYNAERWLERTMRSVLAQTCTEYEYIIVDGGSKDGTVDIIRRMEPLFEGRLAWKSEPDKGLYDAMNKGIAWAKGDFLWFVNAGDEIYAPETLAHIMAETKEDTDIVYGKACVVNAEGVKVGEHHKVTPPDLQRRHMLNGLVVCHQAILVRRSVAGQYDTRYRIAADYDWCIRAVTASRRNVYLDEYVCKFLTDGISHRQRKRSWTERFHIMRRHFGLCATLRAHFKIALSQLSTFHSQLSTPPSR
ncbi:MAG: glycosyltransferase [Paludibacteraceae bacterium]|nr:glycosyltransferase [Paludibacteraceae bacterium]